MTDRLERTHAPAAQPSRPASRFRLNLEQQRKRAKDLQHALLAGDADGTLRFRRHHPKGQATFDIKKTGRLSEAQLVVARELGLPSWARLKAHILAMQQAQASIAKGADVPDGDLATLHIRCGSDLREPLKAAGFAGDFLPYNDPLCQGPVVDDEAWLQRRASFLAQAYGRWTAGPAAQGLDNLQQTENALQSAARHYQRVVIWVEHDSHDQLVLARCLARFAETMPPRLELILVDRYPGTTRFIGLGQLPPEALRLLWRERKTISSQQVTAGRAVWDLLRLGDPRPLAAAARSGLPELPRMATAVRRHCQELPWLRDGLSLTQRLVLQLLAEGSKTINEIWSALVLEREPLPWLGDLMLRFILESMKRVRGAVFIAASGGDQPDWRDERLRITTLGRAVLAGDVDWMSLSPPERWLGGVHIAPDQPCWRWDEQAATPVLQQ